MTLKIFPILGIILITAFFILVLFAALTAAGAADRETERAEARKKQKELLNSFLLNSPMGDGKIKIYISGAISDNPDYKQQFAAAEEYLQDKGWETINPAKISAVLPPLSYSAYMQLSLALLSEASALYLLSGWETSSGAVTEKRAAESLGVAVIYQTEEICNTRAGKAGSQNTSRR
nr:MAG TPA: deoxyribosyltransferase [Caudoviricetes sp.]